MKLHGQERCGSRGNVRGERDQEVKFDKKRGREVRGRDLRTRNQEGCKD